MDSLFIKKHKLFSSLNCSYQDFELNHPINKSIKATQIYIDTQLTLRKKVTQYRAVSQETRSTPLNIVLPALRPPHHISSLSNRSMLNLPETSHYFSTDPIPEFIQPEITKQKKRRLFPIKSSRNPLIND